MNLSLSLKSPKINKPVTFTVQTALLIVAVAFIVVPGKSRSREWRNGTAFRPYIVAAPNVPAPPQGSGYAYRRTITIDHTKVPNTDQSNFPLLVSGTYSYLATVSNGGNVQNANGYDVIFTSDAGCANRLDHEVETYSATTGGVNYWVRLPSLSHTNDTTIYMCYGNSAITTDQSNKTGVWDNNFKALYHLNDQAANTTVTDSSSNGSNGANAANTSGKSVSGKFGKALTYNGTTDYTTTGATQTTSFTWECWFKLTDWTTQSGSSNYSTLMSGVYSTGGALLMLWKDSGWMVQFASDNAGGITSGANSVAPGSWHHAAYTRTGNSGTYVLYLDGEWKGQVASGSNSSNSTITLGTRADSTPQALNGVLDEARISNTARSADWIKTEYNNQSSPATFYTISAASNCCETSATARFDPLNQTGGGGENPLSRNFNWTLPLMLLPGRAGLDLSLSLSYNSLVWTKNGNYISFDDDHGFPGPGFRLGFPVIQPLYYNAETARYAFLLIAGDGSRVELRQVPTTNIYESADSSHLLLDATTMVLRTTDGTQMKYELKGSEFNCTEIKDRNGNYITVNYTSFGRIDNVIDTLGRSVKFNYNADGWPTSITQTWNPGAVIHNWTTFDYGDNTPIQTNFSGLTVSGPSNGSSIKTLKKVTLADGSHYEFSWTSWGQVWKISSFASDNHLLNYRSYNLPQTAQPQADEPPLPYYDCPRFTKRRDWAQYWNGDNDGVAVSSEEALTTFAEPVGETWTMPDNSQQTGMRAQVTAPDGTSNKIYFIGTAGTGSGWRRGLPALVNTYDSGNTLRRQVMTTWTQDNTGVSYVLNPRVTETNTYDPEGNRARVEMTYQPVSFANGTSCQLPRDVYEYAENATTILRSTRTTYNTNAVYTDRRIIGLVSEKQLYEGDINNNGTLRSKLAFFYDNENGSSSVEGTDAPIQHDNTNYSASFVTGRANLSSVRRYDVTNQSSFTTTRTKYNTAGAVVSSIDALNHTVQISYSDSFSDSGNLNTLAYPTRVTDPDSYVSTSKYDYDFGAVTYTRTPKPNSTQPNEQSQEGPEQTFTYDPTGRLQQTTNLVNNAYIRFEYPDNQIHVDTYATIQEGLGEAHSFKITDGTGRVIATAADHPGSVPNLFNGQKFVYDVMGRVIKTSNPAETMASGTPSQWTTVGDDATAGWIYTQQTYDWKSRPLITTNQDGTTKTVSYAGCGCAGGEVATITDEGTIDAGVTKYRQQKIYTDVLGRSYKTEALNWAGGSVYSTTVTSYNARDQVTNIREYAGLEGSSTYQDTIIGYDGFGRLQSQHVPEQNSGTATVWTYNADNTTNTITDARGASQTFSYNNRHLVTSVNYNAPAGITAAPNVTFGYDAAQNRVSMTDGLGSQSYNYDLLSRLSSESRVFTNVGTFALSYEYNLAGELKKLTDASNSTINYSYDVIGRLTGVTGSDTLVGGVSSYASEFQYRAWGNSKQVTVGSRITSFAYNSRLQPTNFNISGGALNQNLEYYNDGKLKFVHNTTDNNFDRAFFYDHVSRLTVAASGGEARQDEGAVPLYEQFWYDSFDNITVRQTETWSNGYSDATTYTNHRRTEWGYDANGSVSAIDTRTYTYDAAGRNTVLSGQRWTPSGYVPSTIASGFDGDGARVREESGGSGSPIATYYLRSTVLGGAIVEELNSSGQKQIGYVYTPSGNALATQFVGENYVMLTQVSPIGSSKYEFFVSNTAIGGNTRREFDPLGANVRLNSGPTGHAGDPGDLSGGGGPMGGRSGGIENPAAGCVMDGAWVPCSFAFRLLRQGAADQCPDNDCGPQARWVIVDGDDGPEKVPFFTLPFMSFANGQGGYFDGQTGVTPQAQADAKPYFRALAARGASAWRIDSNPYQNPPFDISGIRKGLQAALSRYDCREFINDLLDAAKTKKNPLAKSGHIMTLFESVVTGGSFTRAARGDSAGYPTGRIADNNAGIFVFGSSNNPQLLLHDTMIVLHELLHLAGLKSYYTDAQFARIVNGIPQYAAVARVPFPLDGADKQTTKELLEDPGDIRWGGYWGDVLQQKCFE